jgi:hypothetical protein
MASEEIYTEIKAHSDKVAGLSKIYQTRSAQLYEAARICHSKERFL